MSRWISGHWSGFQGSYSSSPTWGGALFFPSRWTALFANCSAPPLLSLYHGTCALVLNTALLGSGPFCFQSNPYEKCKGWTGWSFTLSSHSIMESKRVKVSKSYLCVLWQFRKKKEKRKVEKGCSWWTGRSGWKGLQEQVVSWQGAVHCRCHSLTLRNPPVWHLVRKKGRIFFRRQRLIAFQAEAVSSLSDTLFSFHPVFVPSPSQFFDLLLNNWLLIIP